MAQLPMVLFHVQTNSELRIFCQVFSHTGNLQQTERKPMNVQESVVATPPVDFSKEIFRDFTQLTIHGTKEACFFVFRRIQNFHAAQVSILAFCFADVWQPIDFYLTQHGAIQTRDLGGCFIGGYEPTQRIVPVSAGETASLSETASLNFHHWLFWCHKNSYFSV